LIKVEGFLFNDSAQAIFLVNVSFQLFFPFAELGSQYFFGEQISMYLIRQQSRLNAFCVFVIFLRHNIDIGEKVFDVVLYGLLDSSISNSEQIIKADVFALFSNSPVHSRFLNGFHETTSMLPQL